MQNTAAEKDFLTTSCCERIKWRLRNAKKILMLSRQCGWLRVRVGYIIAKNDCYKYELQDKHKNGNCVFKYLQRYKQVAHTHTYGGAWTSSSIIAHFFTYTFPHTHKHLYVWNTLEDTPKLTHTCPCHRYFKRPQGGAYINSLFKLRR